MGDDYHVDMSGKISNNRTIGVAIVGTRTKIHFGCALRGNLIKLIRRKLFSDNSSEDCARLYAICIFLLLENIKEKINTLIICNDEDFRIVKLTLNHLLGNVNFDIINISEFRKRLGRDIGSLADNYSKIYRRRALKPNRFSEGKKLNIIEVNFQLIKEYWNKIKE